MTKQQNLQELNLKELREKRNELEQVIREVRSGMRFHYEREPAEEDLQAVMKEISERLRHGKI